MASGCRVVPLHDTMGRVFRGDLCTFIVKYKTPNGDVSGSSNGALMNFLSCFESFSLNRFSQFFRAVVILSLICTVCAGVRCR